jgi:hypothetical protein
MHMGFNVLLQNDNADNKQAFRIIHRDRLGNRTTIVHKPCGHM